MICSKIKVRYLYELLYVQLYEYLYFVIILIRVYELYNQILSDLEKINDNDGFQ